MKKYFFAILIIFALAPLAASASVIPKAPNNLGLVGYWSFNEGAGSVADDYSGKGNQTRLTTTGSSLPQWINGKFGKALNFDGSTQYVSGGQNDMLSVDDTDKTVSAWINPANYINSLMGIVDKDFDNGITYGGWGFWINSGNLVWWAQSSSDITDTGTIPTNTWTHVVAVWHHSTDTVDFYINGKLSSTQTNGGIIEAPSGTADFEIGNLRNNLGGFSFAGAIDEVRVYKRALSATEVAALYKAGGSRIGAPVSPGTLGQGLLGWWTMDGADIGSSFFDRSGNGFRGYLVGSYNATSTRKTVGKVGQAFNFMGQNTGGIDLGNSSSLTPSRFTIAGWIYVKDPQTHNYNYIYSNARDNCATGLGGIDFKVYANGLLNGTICAAGTAHGVSGPQIATSTWTFVAFSYDGSNLRLYKDGTLVATQSNTADPGSPSFDTYIGSMGNGNGAIFTLNGKLDDLHLYNRALSATEIQALYNLTAGTHANASSASLDNGTSLQTGLVGLWTFDGKDMYKNVADLSGQGNNGTLNLFTSTSSAVTIGKLGQAIKFNGVDFISVPDAPSLSTGSTITVSAWIYPTSNSAYYPFVAKNDGSGLNFGWEMANSTGILRATLRGALVNANGSALTLNKWQLGTFTYDGTTLNLYLNGALVGSGTGSATLNSSGILYIGQRATNNRFVGSVDDVRVYNRVLSAAEVLQLYNLGK